MKNETKIKEARELLEVIIVFEPQLKAVCLPEITRLAKKSLALLAEPIEIYNTACKKCDKIFLAKNMTELYCPECREPEKPEVAWISIDEHKKKFDEYQDFVHSFLHYLQKKGLITGTRDTCKDIKRKLFSLLEPEKPVCGTCGGMGLKQPPNNGCDSCMGKMNDGRYSQSYCKTMCPCPDCHSKKLREAYEGNFEPKPKVDVAEFVARIRREAEKTEVTRGNVYLGGLLLNAADIIESIEVAKDGKAKE